MPSFTATTKIRLSATSRFEIRGKQRIAMSKDPSEAIFTLTMSLFLFAVFLAGIVGAAP